MPATLNEISKTIVNLHSQIQATERKIISMHNTYHTHKVAKDAVKAAEIQEEIGLCSATLKDLQQQLAVQQEKAKDAFADPLKDEKYQQSTVRTALAELANDECLTAHGKGQLLKQIKADWKLAEEYVEGLESDWRERMVWFESAFPDHDGGGSSTGFLVPEEEELYDSDERKQYEEEAMDNYSE